MKKILIIFLFATTIFSCSDYKQLELNPNVPTSVPASLILAPALTSINEGAWNDVMRANQFYASNYAYYSTNEYTWGAASLRYTTLKNVQKMEEEAIKSGAKALNPYSAMGKFLRAYYFNDMTLKVGDLPMNDALKGLTVDTPKYDSQKVVYMQILKWLEEANADFASLIATGDATLAGDFYFNNNLKAWQKVVNAFHVRVLTHLSKKDTDADLKIKADFANIISNPTKYPLPSANEEGLQYVWNDFSKYPRNPDNFGFNATRENMAKTYVDLLKDYKDARLFVVAEPTEAAIKKGLKATDFDAYEGASTGEDLADMSSKALNGVYSFQNRKRYYSNYKGENTFLIGYPEVCFNIAEGINRGWALGTADDWYKKGIVASMGFYGITNSTDYLAQEKVKYAGNNVDGLKQILNQKYIAFFQNSNYEAYFNWRRTGIPTFLTGVGIANGGKIPLRYQYPLSESKVNANNLKAAVDSQYGGKDDINSTMWILK
jgi:Starch-binding associating with outer membrane